MFTNSVKIIKQIEKNSTMNSIPKSIISFKISIFFKKQKNRAGKFLFRANLRFCDGFCFLFASCHYSKPRKSKVYNVRLRIM
jgi:hypothetical protein